MADPAYVSQNQITLSVEDLLREATVAIRENRLDDARHYLTEVLHTDPKNEQAWLDMAGIVSELDETIYCLQRVLAINPNNDRAKQWLALANAMLPQAYPTNSGLLHSQEEPPVPLLGRYLVAKQFVTEQQLDRALAEQQERAKRGQRRRIGEILVELGFLTRTQLDLAIREQERDFFSLFID